jgi:hypothetical protein
MANPRRRTSGFTTELEAKEAPVTEIISKEEIEIEELVESVATEMFETISLKEEAPTKEEAFIAPSITPVDSGPRFLPMEEPPTPSTQKAPPQPVAPRRHPRNVPKFSRTK